MRELTVDIVLQKAKSVSPSQVTTITLASLMLADISCLTVFVNLKQISLVDNFISRLKVFQFLPKIETLYLRKNMVSELAEISYLKHCKFLTVLSLVDNPIWQTGVTRADILVFVPFLTSLDGMHINTAEIIAAQHKFQVQSSNDLRMDGNKPMPARQQSSYNVERLPDKDKEKVFNLAGINILENVKIDEDKLVTGNEWQLPKNKWKTRKPEISVKPPTNKQHLDLFPPQERSIEK